MKSITIHGLDQQTSKAIQDIAQKKNLSLNKTIKQLIQKALGLTNKNSIDHRQDFIEFCGMWSEEDLNVFNESVSDLSKVNPKDWQ